MHSLVESTCTDFALQASERFLELVPEQAERMTNDELRLRQKTALAPFYIFGEFIPIYTQSNEKRRKNFGVGRIGEILGCREQSAHSISTTIASTGDIFPLNIKYVVFSKISAQRA
jgi:hypothetical protein